MLAWEKLSDEEKEIVSIIKEAFSDEVKDWHVTKKTFSPSKLVYGSGGCARFWYQMFSGVDSHDVYSHTSQRAMASGTASHDDLQKKLSNSDLNIIIEQELTYDDPPIRAFADGVICGSGGEKIPLEIKTTRTEAYEYRDKSFTPADYNVLQLLCYMKILESDKGFLLYEDRNNFDNLIIPVYMDAKNQKIIDDAFNWMRETRAAWEAGTMPKYFTGRRSNSKICKDCPIKQACDNAGEGVVDLPLLKDYNK